MRSLLVTLLVLFCAACDKNETPPPTADPNSKLLGERLIARHGEAFLAQPVLVVYDSGFIVGRGSLDGDFASKVQELGLSPASSLSSGAAPIDVREFYAQEGVELGVSTTDKTVVVDSTSSLTIRLMFGEAGIDALRACEAVKLDRVCKLDGELRARLDDIAASGALLVDGGAEVGRAKIRSGWAVFENAPELSDEAQLELILGDGVHCNLSRWLVDPRDSCTM